MALLGLILGPIAIFNGLRTFGCASVSFDGYGRRAVGIQCYADASGAVPGWLAALGILALGVVMLSVGVAHVRR